MGAPGERRVGAATALAGIVGLHALVQIACVSSAVLGFRLTGGRAAAALGLCLAGAAAFASRFPGEVTVPRAQVAPRDDGSYTLLARVVAVGALCWAATLWARLWMLASRRPSYDWDGLYYHVPALSEWARLGRPGFIGSLPDIPFVNYPMGVEATTFLLHQAFGLSSLVDACNLWYWPLAFFSVVVLAERLGAAGPWRWFAGALLAGVPVIVCQSVTSYTDPAAASCVMAAVAVTVLFVFDDGRAPMWTAVLWGASVGLVLGAKGTGLPMSAAIVVAGVAGVAARARRHRAGRWLPRLAVAACVMLLVGGYWYGRNAYHTGNPVYPVQVKFGAREIVAGYDAARFTENNQPDWLTRFPVWLRGPVSWLQLDAPIQGYAPIGGLGYIWPAAGIPSLALLALWSLRRQRGVHRPELAVAVAVAALLLVAQPALWWSRFTVWLHVLGLASLGCVLDRWWSRGEGRSRLLAAACAVAVLALGAWESERTLRIEQARGRTARGAYLDSAQLLFPGLAETAGFEQLLRDDAIARSRWGRQGTLLGGILALPLGQREVHVLPDTIDGHDLDQLVASGVRWVIWDVEGAGEVPPPLVQRAVEASAYSPSPHATFHILRLRQPPTGSG